MSVKARCRCDELVLLVDAEADDYTDHLVKEDVERDGLLIRYRCVQTGREWVLDFPQTARAGSMCLRRVMTAAELVERLSAEDVRSGERLSWTHPEIEFRVPGSDETLHGIEAAQEWSAKFASDPSLPKSRPISVVAISDDEALVLGDVAYRRPSATSSTGPAHGWWRSRTAACGAASGTSLGPRDARRPGCPSTAARRPSRSGAGS